MRVPFKGAEEEEEKKDQDKNSAVAGRANDKVRQYLWSQLDSSRDAVLRARRERDRAEGQVEELRDRLRGNCAPSARDSLVVNRLLLGRRAERARQERSRVKVTFDRWRTSSGQLLLLRATVENGAGEDVEKVRLWPRVVAAAEEKSGEEEAVGFRMSEEGGKETISPGESTEAFASYSMEDLVSAAASAGSNSVRASVVASFSMGGQRCTKASEVAAWTVSDLVEMESKDPSECPWAGEALLALAGERARFEVRGVVPRVLARAMGLVAVCGRGDEKIMTFDPEKRPFLREAMVQIPAATESRDGCFAVVLSGTRTQVSAMRALMSDLKVGEVKEVKEDCGGADSESLRAALLEELDLLAAAARGAQEASAAALAACPVVRGDDQVESSASNVAQVTETHVLTECFRHDFGFSRHAAPRDSSGPPPARCCWWRPRITLARAGRGGR